MMDSVTAPYVLPKFVMMCAVRFRDDDEVLHGVQLPPALERAVPRRRQEFVAGRSCALDAIRQLDPALSVTDIPIGPFRAPVWPAGLCGSITHSAGWAAAAIARTRDVASLGIDTEPMIAPATAASIEAQIATRDEMTLAGGAVTASAALTLVFSAKESLFKCLFPIVGRFFEYRDAELVHVDPSARQFSMRLTTTLTQAFAAGARIDGHYVSDGERVHTSIALGPDFVSL
jgi:enterobactin synthetase component D